MRRLPPAVPSEQAAWLRLAALVSDSVSISDEQEAAMIAEVNAMGKPHRPSKSIDSPEPLRDAVRDVIAASHGSGDGRIVVPVPVWTALRRAYEARTANPMPGPVDPPRPALPPPGSMIDDARVHRDGKLIAAFPIGPAEPAHRPGLRATLEWIASCPKLPHETEESMVVIFRKTAADALAANPPRSETAPPSQEDDDEAIRRVARRLLRDGDLSRHVVLEGEASSGWVDRSAARNRALGNAVTPQQTEAIGRVITAMVNESEDPK